MDSWILITRDKQVLEAVFLLAAILVLFIAVGRKLKAK